MYRVNDLRDSAHRHRPAWVRRHAAAAGKPICLSRSLSRYDSSARVPCGTSGAMGRRAGWIGSESGGRTVQPRKATLTTNLCVGPPDGRTRWQNTCHLVHRCARPQRPYLRTAGPGEAGGVRQRSALRDAYPLRRTRVSGAESDGVTHSKGFTPRCARQDSPPAPQRPGSRRRAWHGAHP